MGTYFVTRNEISVIFDRVFRPGDWAIGTTVVCGAASLIGNQYVNWGCTILSYPRRFECWLHQMFTCYLNYCGIADYTGIPALGNRLHPYHEYDYDYGHS